MTCDSERMHVVIVVIVIGSWASPPSFRFRNGMHLPSFPVAMIPKLGSLPHQHQAP